jgi:hypothetical protein
MRRRLTRAIREKQYSEVSSLFGRKTTPVQNVDKRNGADNELNGLLPQGGKIRGTLNGRIFRARVQRNGTVRFKGKSYSSLSLAARAITKRSTNGWWFWQIERGRQNWVRMNKIRKAGTPIYLK